MFLTPEQQEVGRRTFLKALAGTPALGLLGAAAAMKGPVPGGPVRLGIVGVGGQGRALLNNLDPLSERSGPSPTSIPPRCRALTKRC